MLDKQGWNKKICMEHITQMRSPFEGMGNNGNVSPILQRMKDAVNKIRPQR